MESEAVVAKNNADYKCIWGKWQENVLYTSITVMGKLPITKVISKYQGEKVFAILSVRAGRKFKAISCGFHSAFLKEPLDFQVGNQQPNHFFSVLCLKIKVNACSSLKTRKFK